MLANIIALLFATVGVIFCDSLPLRCISIFGVALTSFVLGALWVNSVPEMEER